MRLTLLGLVLVSVGCGGLQLDPSKEVPPPEHADEAIQLVYADFGMTRMPSVHWYGGDARCNGWGYKDQTDTCVLGDQLDDLVVVAALDGYRISEVWDNASLGCALVHEMAHRASDLRGEGGDPDHRGHFFAPGGDAEQETIRLSALGM